jgi:tetratricopeptide (TPR) repeat protein
VVDTSGIDLEFRPVSYESEPAPSDRKEDAITRSLASPYLPPFKQHEVPICVFWLESTTHDVIELRARPDRGKIRYRVVDEYWDQGLFTYSLRKKSSERPLTLRELIDLIDTAKGDDGIVGLIAGHRAMQEESSFEKQAAFVRVWSSFYPQLGEYYQREADAWLAERRREVITEELTGEWERFASELLRRRRPPRGPADFPADYRVNALTRDDVQELTTWACSQPGVATFSVQRPEEGPARPRMAPPWKERSFDLVWTIGGATYTDHFDYADNPTVDEAFRTFSSLLASTNADVKLFLPMDEPAEALSSLATQTESLVRLADRCWAAGQLGEAEGLYRRAIDLAKADLAKKDDGGGDIHILPYLRHIADSYLAEGRHEAAVQEYQRILHVEEEHALDSSNTLNCLAIACFEAGDLDRAVELFSRGTESWKRR